ncbi:MAG: hypothetical protein AB8G99_12400 [Planctomycetaceae bacterium]
MRFVIFALVLLGTQTAIAQGPQRYESKNFVMRTDLPEAEAKQLLEKLETMLDIISRYWGVPNRRQIECVVVKDLKRWPAGSIDPRAMPSMQARAGITLADFQRRGNQVRAQAVAYSAARTSTVQHEAVHAFSYYSFGHCGPEWYSEGMAEMGSYWVEGNASVTAPPHTTRYLRNAGRKSIKEITSGKSKKATSWQDYAWRWALCHLLANNENYSKKFRPLGLNMLARKKGSFTGTYGKQLKELEFEFDFFLDHVEPGFDVNRCRWDWGARFRKTKPGKPSRCTVEADRGWQASGVRVEQNQQYRLTAGGSWKLGTESEEIAFDGQKVVSGAGELEAVIMSRMKLAEPFVIDDTGHFTAKESGDLYLRCSDRWSSLADNSGEVAVSIETTTKP